MLYSVVTYRKVIYSNEQLTGTWYVYASYDYSDIEGLDCLVAFCQLTPDGNIRNYERGKNLTTNELFTVNISLFAYLFNFLNIF